MQVKVTFKNTDTIDEVKRRAEEKAAKIKKLMRAPIQVSYIFFKDNLNHVVELTVTGDGAHFAASVRSVDYFSGIDEAIDKILIQLKRYKEKMKNKKGAKKRSML